MIDNKTGKTKYYEYGRYHTNDVTKGKVRKVKIPDVKIKDGKPTEESLNIVLKTISDDAGHHGNIDGAYIDSDEFEKMNNYAIKKYQESNPIVGGENYKKDREEYDITSNNCATFAADVVNQDENVKRPLLVFDKSPKNMVSEYQDEGYKKVFFDSKKNQTKIDE